MILIMLFAKSNHYSVIGNLNQTDTSSNYPIDLTSENNITILSIRNSDGDLQNLNIEFSTNYLTYGEYPMVLDYTSATTEIITETLLNDLKPDILFLPNLFQSGNLLTDDEIDVIQSYSNLSHGIVASHGTLESPVHAKLGPLFGIDQAMIASAEDNMPIVGFSGIFDLNEVSHSIFNGLQDDYTTGAKATMTPLINGFQSI